MVRFERIYTLFPCNIQKNISSAIFWLNFTLQCYNFLFSLYTTKFSSSSRIPYIVRFLLSSMDFSVVMCGILFSEDFVYPQDNNAVSLLIFK